MSHITFTGDNIFVKLIGTIADIAPSGEAGFEFGQSSLDIISSDATGNMAIYSTQDKSAFQEYEMDFENTRKIFVGVRELYRLIKGFKKTDLIKIKLGERLRIVITSKVKCAYDQDLIDDTSAKQPPKKDFGLPGKILIDAEMLSDALTMASKTADNIRLKLDKDKGFMVSGYDDRLIDRGNVKDIIYQSDYAGPTIESRYSMDYLKYIHSLCKLFTDVEISLGLDMPLEVLFKCYTSNVKLLIAPRVENK